MEKNSTVIVVVAVALVGPGPRVLMQKRPANKAHGGLWEFPGGKVEMGETPESALVRETDEELGVALEPADLEPLSFATQALGSAGGSMVLLLYRAREWRGDPKALEPDTEVAWVDFSALLDLPMPPLDVPLAASLIRSIEGVAKAEGPS